MLGGCGFWGLFEWGDCGCGGLPSATLRVNYTNFNCAEAR